MLSRFGGETFDDLNGVGREGFHAQPCPEIAGDSWLVHLALNTIPTSVP